MKWYFDHKYFQTLHPKKKKEMHIKSDVYTDIQYTTLLFCMFEIIHNKERKTSAGWTSIHLAPKYLLSTYYVPGTDLRIGVVLIEKSVKSLPALLELHPVGAERESSNQAGKL